MRFDGKVALVTGGASGIGLHTAAGFADLGAEVIIGDINVEGGEAAASEMRSKGHDVRFLRLDLTDAGSIKQWKESALSIKPRIDVIANVAGWSGLGPFVDNTDEFVDKVIALNFRGAIELMRVFFPVLIAQKRGKVVLTASDAGRVGSGGESVYSATKGGIIALTRSLAREGARHGINVNCISPGAIDTPLLHTSSEKRLQAFLGAIPLRRFGEASEVADGILFMASERANYITGQVLSINGGLAMV
jgi:2-hydroxycyclohexanecarboxyl-CoA dehydrogenase